MPWGWPTPGPAQPTQTSSTCDCTDPTGPHSCVKPQREWGWLLGLQLHSDASLRLASGDHSPPIGESPGKLTDPPEMVVIAYLQHRRELTGVIPIYLCPGLPVELWDAGFFAHLVSGRRRLADRIEKASDCNPDIAMTPPPDTTRGTEQHDRIWILSIRQTRETSELSATARPVRSWGVRCSLRSAARDFSGIMLAISAGNHSFSSDFNPGRTRNRTAGPRPDEAGRYSSLASRCASCAPLSEQQNAPAPRRPGTPLPPTSASDRPARPPR